MSKPHFRNRRRFRSHVVNCGLRFRLIWDELLFAFLAAVAAVLILYYLSNRQIGDSLFSAHLSLRETKELLDKGVKVAGVVTFVAVLIFGFWSVIDAHRIAGPMHRLQRLLMEISGGELRHEIAFRKSDEFQDVAAAADAMVESLDSRIADAQAKADQLVMALHQGNVDHARELAEELKDGLAFFKTGEVVVK